MEHLAIGPQLHGQDLAQVVLLNYTDL